MRSNQKASSYVKLVETAASRHRPTGSDMSNKIAGHPASLVVALGELDFRPHLKVFHASVQRTLVVEWSAFGQKLAVTKEHWDLASKKWIADESKEDEAHSILQGGAAEGKLDWQLDESTLYRFSFKNLHELAAKSMMAPISYVYWLTWARGCADSHKCCTTDTTSQCVKKKTGFIAKVLGQRTCGAEKGRRGARLDGEPSSMPCRWCSTGFFDELAAAPDSPLGHSGLRSIMNLKSSAEERWASGASGSRCQPFISRP